MTKIKFMSTFSGVGGLELGLSEKVYECVGLSEIFPSARDVLRYNHPDLKNYGDITEIDPKELPEFDMLVGGTPCQNFSMAGNRQGLKGKKSALFYHYVRILESCSPEYFLWENVKGSLSSSNGHDFHAVLNEFIRLGYNIQYQVLNSKDLGLAQSRTRIFVFGSKTDKFPPLIDYKKRTIKADKIRFNKFGGTIQNDGVINTLTRTYGPNQGDSPKLAMLDSLEDSLDQGMIRLFTPLECERFMGWPDNHTKYGRRENGEIYELKDDDRRKACGNGIASICLQNLNHRFDQRVEKSELKMVHGFKKISFSEMIKTQPQEKIYWPHEACYINGNTYKINYIQPKVKNQTIKDVLEKNIDTKLKESQVLYLKANRVGQKKS